MTRKKTRRSRSDWQRIVTEYEAVRAQETQEAFARRKQLNIGTFRYWLYKVRGVDAERPIRFVEVMTERGHARPASDGHGGDLEVELCGGRCMLRFGTGTDADWIGEVVEALLARLAC